MEVVNSKPIAVTHDGLLNIATGRSRKETRWKSSQMLWSNLVRKLSVTHRTAESYAEYMSSDKERQSEIKDVGGFVGGHIAGGRRKTDKITNRHILTLDVDFGTAEVFDDFVMLYGNACVMYTTHKHCPENFRGRLIIPLDRPVFRDEYQAIGRRIAGDLGIDIFDDTTFEPSRLMYWPSTPRDGEYLFEFNDGEFLSADEVLSVYHDWKDITSWPISSRVSSTIERSAKKQGDPLEKPGLIGVFCRCYTIQEAIDKFLPDVYDDCGNGRYTYKGGSTAAGLVLYEDKFAFSHHGTDPAGGKLCNAFDLVRIHKFGAQDEDAKPDTPNNRLPSYLKMCDLASGLPEVRKIVVNEKLEDARESFSGVELDDIEDDDDTWKTKLDVDRKNNIRATTDNIMIILENDPKLKAKFKLNDFRHTAMITGNLPWRKYSEEKPYFDADDKAGLRYYLESSYGIDSVRKINDAASLVFAKNSFHPIRDYLNAQTWDGIKRLETLLIDYLGAEDSQYVKAVTRKAFTAAVARVFKPGIKYDYVLTIIGAQGVGKSTLLKKMGGEWYSDSFTTVIGKEAYEQLQGAWLVEIGELAGLKRSENETTKHFLSKQEDAYRPAYGETIMHYPRQCVFFATTNSTGFLKDPTGARRFWPVNVHVNKPALSVFNDLTPEVVGQLWAEAVALYKRGEKLFLPSQIEEMAKDQQEAHSEDNEKIGLIQSYLDIPIPKNWYSMDRWERRDYIQQSEEERQRDGKVELMQRDKVCVLEIWCELFQGDLRNKDYVRNKEIQEALMKIEGWEEYRGSKQGRLKFGDPYGLQRAYVRQSRA